MGRALVDGIVKQVDPLHEPAKYRLALTARRAEHLEDLERDHRHALVGGNNVDQDIWAPADRFSGIHVIVIGAQQEKTAVICRHISSALKITEDLRKPENRPRPVVVVLAPQITAEQVEAWLPEGMAVIKTVPEPRAGKGSERQDILTAWGNEHATGEIKGEVELVLKSVAKTVKFVENEDQLEIPVGGSC